MKGMDLDLTAALSASGGLFLAFALVAWVTGFFMNDRLGDIRNPTARTAWWIVSASSLAASMLAFLAAIWTAFAI